MAGACSAAGGCPQTQGPQPQQGGGAAPQGAGEGEGGGGGGGGMPDIQGIIGPIVQAIQQGQQAKQQQKMQEQQMFMAMLQQGGGPGLDPTGGLGDGLGSLGGQLDMGVI